jgi:protein-tyrosine kinase
LIPIQELDMQPKGISTLRGEYFDTAISPDQIREPTKDAIGQLMLAMGRLNAEDVDRVIGYAGKRHLRFGEAALKLGLVSRHELNRVIATQFGYPYLEPGAGGYSSQLITAYDPFSAKGEALRTLRIRLSQQWFDAGHAALAIMGPTGREGSSFTAANLAVAFSQIGQSTVLIDADLRTPSQHKYFNVGNSIGLSAVLSGRTAIDAATIKLPSFRDLSLIPAGVTPPNAADMLGLTALEEVVIELTNRYRIVLFDSPPYNSATGTERLARTCGGALMIFRQNHTRLVEARDLLNKVQETGASVVGSAIMRF